MESAAKLKKETGEKLRVGIKTSRQNFYVAGRIHA
jgi:hypothetical protein